MSVFKLSKRTPSFSFQKKRLTQILLVITKNHQNKKLVVDKTLIDIHELIFLRTKIFEPAS